ncbi:hypothetical protein TRICI_003197 [Trichomonascus ciferrii]|uniref:ABC transporter domain-containing protein n=1 Tax=Trichomonascus ciferrii TaxID=44093 RepID=A0A642V4F3_9ASCO|nr:hypothetical protein TRICI_003197 [Trichomonascus ciferrii]
MSKSEKSSSSDKFNSSGFSWKGVTIDLPSKGKTIIDNNHGAVREGELLALMGPSGCGKTTLLNFLAGRGTPKKSTSTGEVMLNDRHVTTGMLRQLSSYVEQEDSLIGSLTVRETIDYAAKFQGLAKSQRLDLVTSLIKKLGLEDQANTLIGTPVSKGISGGQKRRVSVASQLITQPKVLFLDEPTSGLDSKASLEVIARIKEIAREHRMIVIASIHQPSSTTFNLFDRVMFLAKGKTVYTGPTEQVVPYFASINRPIALHVNPAEFILDLINTDFGQDSDDGIIDELQGVYQKSDMHDHLLSVIDSIKSTEFHMDQTTESTRKPNVISQTFILLQRLFVKSRRDLLAYYIRVAMYLGLAIMMGTVWLRLSSSQDSIIPFQNAIFFSGAFMSFMAVAYIPSYLEDLSSYKKEQMNGLYGPTAFVFSNFMVGAPFLFFLALLFSIPGYFLVNFRESASGFFTFVMWLFLDLLAAESLVVLLSSIFPIFVVALALTASANGLWMCVNGFLVNEKILNVFWYYTFYWINYQRYVYQGMIFNEMKTRVYDCGPSCECMYQSELADQCKIAGEAVLKSVGYGRDQTGMWVGILIAIIFAYRLLAWSWLQYKSRK